MIRKYGMHMNTHEYTIFHQFYNITLAYIGHLVAIERQNPWKKKQDQRKNLHLDSFSSMIFPNV